MTEEKNVRLGLRRWIDLTQLINEAIDYGNYGTARNYSEELQRSLVNALEG